MEVIEKIKAVLGYKIKDKANLLTERTRFSQNLNSEKNSSNLSELQFALTNFKIVSIDYENEAGKPSERLIEPFALVSTTENWLLIAWCRLCKEFRYFRLDRIRSLQIRDEQFKPHEMTLQEFFERHPYPLT